LVGRIFNGPLDVFVAQVMSDHAVPFELPSLLKFQPKKLVIRGRFFLTATNLHEALLSICLRLNHSLLQRFHPRSKPLDVVEFLGRENLLIASSLSDLENGADAKMRKSPRFLREKDFFPGENLRVSSFWIHGPRFLSSATAGSPI